MNELEVLIPENLWAIVLIATTYSPIQMAIMQKIKLLSFIKSSVSVWIANLITSLGIGYLFTFTFYTDIDFLGRIWVGIFGFLGAIGIYEFFKASSILPYTPKAMPEKNICIPIDNKINYEGE